MNGDVPRGKLREMSGEKVQHDPKQIMKSNPIGSMGLVYSVQIFIKTNESSCR